MRNENIIELLDNLARIDAELARLKSGKLTQQEKEIANNISTSININDFMNEIKNIMEMKQNKKHNNTHYIRWL